MRASVERRRAEEARKQARKEELAGLLGAGLAGLTLALPFMAIVVAVYILSVGLAYERGHNGGYNDGWNDGRADGWQGCVEEDNLYERY